MRQPPAVRARTVTVIVALVALVASVLAPPLGDVAAAVGGGSPVPVAAPGALGGFELTQLAQQSHSDGKGQGSAIAVADGIAVVSNGGSSSDGLKDDTAAVYVYAENSPSPGAWGLVQTLTACSASDSSSCSGSHRWGQVLDFDGTTLAVGDPTEDCSDDTGDVFDNCKGQVMVFTVDSTDPSSWTHVTTISPEQPNELNNLGSAVSVSGNWLAIGAPGAHEGWPASFPSVEYVEIWDLAPSGGGKPQKVFKKRAWDFQFPPLDALAVELGASVAIDGDWAFFGAPASDEPGGGSVCVAHYTSKGTDSAGNPNPAAWHTVAPCITSEGQGDWGRAVAYSDTTGVLAIGAPTTGTQTGDPPGAVVLYTTQNGTSLECLQPVGTSCDQLDTTGFPDGDLLGTSLRFSPNGDVLLAGAPGPSSDPGVVAVYEQALPWTDGSFPSWGLAGTVDAGTDQQDGASFGAAVGIGSGANPGEVLVAVGAPDQSNPDPPQSTGFAYVFTAVGNAVFGLSAPDTGGDPLVAAPGETVTITSTLTNDSPNEALGVTVAPGLFAGPGVDVPTAITPIAGYAPAGFWSCTDTLTCAATGLYPAGASTTFSVTLDIPDEQTAVGRWEVLLWAWWDNPTIGGSVTASTWFLVGSPVEVGSVDLSVAQAPPQGVLLPGVPGAFEATVTNTATLPLSDPVVSLSPVVSEPGDDLDLLAPGPTSRLGTVAPGWTCLGPTCRYDGNLLPGAEVTFDGLVTFSAGDGNSPFGATMPFAVEVSASWQNGPGGVTTATASTDASVGSPVALTTTQPDDPVTSGASESWSWTVTNVGTAPLGGVGALIGSEKTAITVESVTGAGPGEAGWVCEPRVGSVTVEYGCVPDVVLGIGQSATLELVGVVASDVVLSFGLGWEAPLPYALGPTDLTTTVGDPASGTVSVTTPSGLVPYFSPATFSITAMNTSAVGLDDPTLDVSAAASPGDPGGITFTSIEGGWTCDGTTCTSDEFAPGASVSFELEVSGTATASAPDQDLTLDAELGWSNGTDGEPGSASGSATSILGEPVSFEFASQSPTSVVNGDEVTWTWTLTNVSNASLLLAELAVLFDPDEVQASTFTPPARPWECSATLPACLRLVPTDPDEAVTFSVRGTVDAVGPTVELLAVAQYTDAATGVNTRLEAPAVTPVGAQAGLAIDATLEGGRAPRPRGSSVRVDVSVVNEGPSPATRPVVRFSVPAGLTLEAATLPDGTRLEASSIRRGTRPVTDAGTTASWSCSVEGDAVVRCTAPTHDAGAVHRFEIEAEVDASTRPGQVLAVAATVEADTPDQEAADNSTEVLVTVGGGSGGASLPRTGLELGWPVLLALLAIGMGGGLLAASRRRSPIE